MSHICLLETILEHDLFFLLISIQSLRQFLPLIDNYLKTFVIITYFWHFVKTFSSKNFKYTNVLVATMRVSKGASLHIAKMGFQFSLRSSIGFGVGS
jgi:hypothetical protein